MPYDNRFNIEVLEHPLAARKLALMRNTENCGTTLFRRLARELGILLAYEATRSLPASYKKSVVVPVLRSGLPLSEGALEIMPSARVGHLGVRRTDKGEVVEHLVVLPDPEDRSFVVMDSIVGSGRTAALACDILRKEGVGAERIRFCCILAAPEGIARMDRLHPDVRLFTVAIDAGLDGKGFIMPGFGGDADDRMFGVH